MLACSDDLALSDRGHDGWHELEAPFVDLGGEFFLVSASGAYLHGIRGDFARRAGIIELSGDGTAWRVAWGFRDGARPTSEFASHLRIHSVRKKVGAGDDRVVYHAHCPHSIVMSTLLAPDARTWSRALWKCMTETIVVVPEGIGVVGWMVPGGDEIARSTSALMERYRTCAWTQHGLVSCGRDFDDAFGRMHMVEKGCGLYLEARMACGGKEPPFMVGDAQLRAIGQRYGVEVNEAFLD